MKARVESDPMGSVKIPEGAYYGANTQRAVQNFPISGSRFPRSFIGAIGEIKRSAAQVCEQKRYYDPKIAAAVARAAKEVAEGKWDAQFVVDVFQTGSGTSTNMNANEVIAHRARELMRGGKGEKKVHPNDHVNFGQSSNDVFPSAMHISLYETIQRELIPSLERLAKAMHEKSRLWHGIVKTGRTHLQDATPIRVGQVFSGYADQVDQAVKRLRIVSEPLTELALGGTAVGTGINCPKGFAKSVIALISKRMNLKFKEAPNHFSAQAAKDSYVDASGALRTTAIALMKIGNDIRWLASGPRDGLGELRLPETQPGSSIMPGKVNPVIIESLLMVCAQVMGNDLVVALGGQWGSFELNTMMPVMTQNALESAELLAKSAENFRTRCVVGMKVNTKRCKETVEQSLAMATALAPKIGYDQAARIAKEAYRTGKTVREIAVVQRILPTKELKALLDPISMTEPN